MAQVGLFKRNGTYEKDGRNKTFTNFYLRCGDCLVPVQVCYYENEDGRDPQYAGRKEVLKAFAETLPEREERTTRPASPSVATGSAAQQKKPSAGKQADEFDENIPF